MLLNAVQDPQGYLDTSMGVAVTLDSRDPLRGWEKAEQSIVVGIRDQLRAQGFPEGAKRLRNRGDVRRVAICGFDEPGAMFGFTTWKPG